MSKQENEDFSKPAPALSSWEIEAWVNQEVEKLTAPRPFDDKRMCEEVSQVLTGLEESFALILEETQLSKGQKDASLKLHISAAVGLMFTTRCRREIETGMVGSAAWTMHAATDTSNEISKILRDEVHGSALKRSREQLAGLELGRENRQKNEREKMKTRVGDWRRLRREGKPDPEIWKYLADEDEITIGRARQSVKRELKRQDEEASRSEADS